MPRTRKQIIHAFDLRVEALHAEVAGVLAMCDILGLLLEVHGTPAVELKQLRQDLHSAFASISLYRHARERGAAPTTTPPAERGEAPPTIILDCVD